MYQCVATSVAGFVQQLAVGYVTHGYYFFVTGEIPAHKDPTKTDRKIIEQYGIDISKWGRMRRKKSGEASLQYLRFGHFFVLIATHGDHPFFDVEAKRLKDMRESPLRFHGYSISCRRGWRKEEFHASVRIDLDRYLKLKAHFEDISVHRSVENLTAEFLALPFEPYAPLKNQLFVILRAVNRKRLTAGLEPVPNSAIRRFRKSKRVFEEVDAEVEETNEGEMGSPKSEAETGEGGRLGS